MQVSGKRQYGFIDDSIPLMVNVAGLRAHLAEIGLGGVHPHRAMGSACGGGDMTAHGSFFARIFQATAVCLAGFLLVYAGGATLFVRPFCTAELPPYMLPCRRFRGMCSSFPVLPGITAETPRWRCCVPSVPLFMALPALGIFWRKMVILPL